MVRRPLWLQMLEAEAALGEKDIPLLLKFAGLLLKKAALLGLFPQILRH